MKIQTIAKLIPVLLVMKGSFVNAQDSAITELTIRKVLDTATFGGDVSPDGRYHSVINWETFNLGIRDLAPGETHDIRDITSDGRSTGCAGASSWSPDGKQIAYEWVGNSGYEELRIVGLDGSEPRVLWRGEYKEPSSIHPRDWSPDGKHILSEVRYKVDVTTEIVLVSVADGSLQTLRSRGVHISGMSFSPDGRYVVYARQVKEKDGLFGLFLLATDGSGEELPLVGHLDGDNKAPVWAPDGKTIVFNSNRDPIGSSSLWLTRVIDGKQVGEPQFVMRSAGGIVPFGFTRKGSLYCGAYCFDGRSDIYVTSLDMETGEVISLPRRLPLGRSNNFPSWSPDGEKLAYYSRRPSPTATGNDFRGVLVIRSLGSGEEREIFKENWQKWTNIYLQWSPDGRSILRGGNSLGIHLIDIQTGRMTTVVKSHPRIKFWGLAWSLDGRTIFYTREHQETGKNNRSFSIVAHELATGEERELYQGGNSWDSMAISPDGRELAFQDEGKGLMVIPVAGGEARTLNEREGFSPAAWTPDGRYLLCVKLTHVPFSGVDKMEVWRISAGGGEPEKLWETNEHTRWGSRPSFHPDGQRIAYSKGDPDSIQKELLVIDNLLTTIAADK